MAGSRLLTKILADFLFGLYLLNYELKHATNHTQDRCAAYKKSPRANRHIWFLPTRKANAEKPKEPVLLPTLDRKMNRIRETVKKEIG